MSFTTHEPTAIVLSTMNSGWEEWSSSPEATDSGWDTITVNLAKDYGSTGANGVEVASEFYIGQRIGQSNFWITGLKPRLIAGAIWGCDVMGKGLLKNRQVKISGGTGVTQQSAEDVFVMGLGVVDKLQSLEVAPAIDIEYISFSSPQTIKVGQAGSPRYATAVRASRWNYGILGDKTVTHFPFGWVMVDMTWDKLVGVDVWLIKERWQYIFQISP